MTYYFRISISTILSHLQGKYQLIVSLLYGCGFRLREVLALRIKDIDFHNQSILVFHGKGAKDRYTILPASLKTRIQEQMQESEKLHQKDHADGYGMTSVPPALKRKYDGVLKDFSWQYLFPSSTRCVHPYDGYVCRHHIHETAFTKQLRKAVKASDITRRVTAHTFRHSFATQLLKTGSDIRTVQELLGHSDIRTTEIYTHVVGQTRAGTTSPIDLL